MCSAAAYNDYFIEEWLSVDRRLKYAPCARRHRQRKSAASASILRSQRSLQPLVNVLTGSGSDLNQACEELGLPVYVHVTGIVQSIFSGHAPAAEPGVPEKMLWMPVT